MKPKYVLEGIVIHGARRGKTLGFPTANIPLTADIPEGVYVSEVVVDTITYPAATFIGAAETFNEKTKYAESYILNFSENIYGKKIIIKLYNKLRDNIKFSSPDKLIGQMRKDINKVRKFFSP